MVFATIIASNYQSRAIVLAQSLRSFHPHATLVVLVVDRVPGYSGHWLGMSNVIEMGLADIRLDDLSCDRMRMYYDVTEFCTALKPQLLLTLLETNSTVCYLDPDMLIMDDISDVHTLAEQRSALVTPHCLTQMPRDGYEPDEMVLLRSGVFNLGFLAVSTEMRPFLTWWAAHLEVHCINDHKTGLFVDQKWFDLLPALASSYEVSRDPTLNVAYWNLYERWQEDPERRRPRLFHFSGFHPMLPDGVLTGHFQQTRPLGRNIECISALMDEYSQQLLHSGFETDATKQYGHGSFENEREITQRMRRSYRAAILAGDPGTPRDPWAHAGSDFCEWFDRREDAVSQEGKQSE